MLTRGEVSGAASMLAGNLRICVRDLLSAVGD